MPSRAVSSLEEVCTVMMRSLLVLGWAPGPRKSGARCSMCSKGAGLVPGLKIQQKRLAPECCLSLGHTEGCYVWLPGGDP